MCMGKHPFTAQNEGALIRKIMKGVYPPATGYAKPLLDLVAVCLAYDQRRRPTAAQLLRRADIIAKAKALGISLAPAPEAETRDRAVFDLPSPDPHAQALPYAPHVANPPVAQPSAPLGLNAAPLQYPPTAAHYPGVEHPPVPENHPFYSPAQHARAVGTPQPLPMHAQQQQGAPGARPYSARHVAPEAPPASAPYALDVHQGGSGYSAYPGGAQQQAIDARAQRPATAGGYYDRQRANAQQQHSHPFALHKNSNPYGRPVRCGCSYSVCMLSLSVRDS